MTASDDPTLTLAGDLDPAGRAAGAPDESSDLVLPAAEPERSRRNLARIGIVVLSLIALSLLVLVALDRRPTPRPPVEVVDQGGLAHLHSEQVAAAKQVAGQLGYPVTLVLADRPESRGAWERSLGQLAQPNRLVIGVTAGDRLIAVARGPALPLTASEELAIRAAGRAPAAAGDPSRALDYALTQAYRIGSPYPAESKAPPADPALAQLALSVLAPCAVLGLALGAVRHRLRGQMA